MSGFRHSVLLPLTPILKLLALGVFSALVQKLLSNWWV